MLGGEWKILKKRARGRFEENTLNACLKISIIELKFLKMQEKRNFKQQFE